MKYIRPECYGVFTCDGPASGIDWRGMAETACVVAGGALLLLFGDAQSVTSFLVAFLVTLAVAR